MNNHTITGISDSDASLMTSKLNKLLSNYSIFHMNLRGLHWNICGNHFFRLHKEYEREYLDAYNKIDEIAERILQLGALPLHTFKDYIDNSDIKPTKNVINDSEGIKNILESYKIIIKIESEIMELTDKIKDYGTNDMIASYMREQSKRVWMFNSYITKCK
ncbi:MAG: Dps family protein [Solitalea-like symbiont of Acarus siro]